MSLPSTVFLLKTLNGLLWLYLQEVCRVFYLSSFNVMCSIFNAITQTFEEGQSADATNLLMGKIWLLDTVIWIDVLWEGGKVVHISKKHFIKMCRRVTVKIHMFSTGWRRVVWFMFWPLNPLYPSERKLGQPQYQLGCIYEEKSLSQPPEILVLQPKTSLFTQLFYSSSQNWCFIIPKYSVRRFSVHIILFAAYPCIFLGAFETLWSLLILLCPFVWNSWTTGLISMKFDVSESMKNYQTI